MGFLTQLVATRNNPLESPSVPLGSLANSPSWFLNWMGGEPTESNEHVTPHSALQVVTVVACCKLISEGVGQLPIQIIELLARGHRVVHDHPYFSLLSSEWNNEMTSTVALQVSLVHALLWGTTYVQIERDHAGRVVGLWPRKPWLTLPMRDPQGNLVYVTTDTPGNKKEIVPAADMICVPGMSLDGYLGEKVIIHARQAIGLAMALERHAARFFGNAAVSSGNLEVPGELGDEAYARLKTSMEQQHTGANRFRMMLLEGGTKFSPTSSPNDQAQFIESRKQARSEVCSLFRCPLHMVASDESRGVKSNTEQVSQDFLTFTLMPWIVKYTQEFNRKLFPKLGRSAGKYAVRFHTYALMSADSAGRMAYYVQGRNAGILTANECREAEGLEVVGDEADILMVPLNMIPAAQLLTAGADPLPMDQDEDDILSPEANSLFSRIKTTYSGLFEDGFGRLSNRSTKDPDAVRKCLMPACTAVSASIRQLLSNQYRMVVSEAESTKAIAKYMSGLASRADSLDQTVELERALKTLTYSAYRDLAVALAKKEIPINETTEESTE